MKELDWNQINDEVVRIQKSNSGRKLCVFFDENIGIEPDVGQLPLALCPVFHFTPIDYY